MVRVLFIQFCFGKLYRLLCMSCARISLIGTKHISRQPLEHQTLDFCSESDKHSLFCFYFLFFLAKLSARAIRFSCPSVIGTVVVCTHKQGMGVLILQSYRSRALSNARDDKLSDNSRCL